MKIHCPACNAEYEVEESAVGRRVQCECGHKWEIQPDTQKTNEIQVISAIWNSTREIIKANLKSPASAKFEFENRKDTITYLGGNTFEVNSVVDSQNSFGAMIRNFFTVICFYNGQFFIPIFWKIDEQFETHQIKPKEIRCLNCQNHFYHDISFETTDIICPHCGKKTSFVDFSLTGCLQKILLAVIVIPLFILFVIGVFWFFFSLTR